MVEEGGSLGEAANQGVVASEAGDGSPANRLAMDQQQHVLVLTQPADGGKAAKATLELQELGLGLMEGMQGTNLLMSPLSLPLW